MRKSFIKTLFILFLFFLQNNQSFAISTHLTGRFVAYETRLLKSCFEFCTSVALFKVEKPKLKENQFVVILVPLLTTQTDESIFLNFNKLKVKIIEDKETENLKIEEFLSITDKTTGEIWKGIEAWNLVKGAKDEKIPFGETLKVYKLNQSTEKVIDKLKQ